MENFTNDQINTCERLLDEIDNYPEAVLIHWNSLTTIEQARFYFYCLLNGFVDSYTAVMEVVVKSTKQPQPVQNCQRFNSNECPTIG